MTPDEFIRMIVEKNPIVPGDEHNYCRFCGATWAEESFAEWQNRNGAAKRPDWLRDHHKADCLWILAHGVTM